MSGQAELIIETAAGYIGVTESPPESNNVIFNTAYYGESVYGSAYPWCCVFVWYVFREAELSGLFYGGGKTASCTALMSYAKDNGLFQNGDYLPGDIIFFNWDGKTDTAQHAGILWELLPSGELVTIEGNTSYGSDSNGGEVMRRTRQPSCVIGAFRPAYTPAAGKDDNTHDRGARYNTLDEIPDYARNTVKLLASANAIRGFGKKDERGFPADMNLSEDMLRLLVIADRAGAFRL